MDGYVEDEYNAVQLAKLLASCFVLRGGQLAVIKQLDADYIVRIQIDLLNWIARRIAAYQNNNKNKKNLRKSLLLFRAMTPLLSMIQNRDALKMLVVWFVGLSCVIARTDLVVFFLINRKAHLDQAFDQAKVQVSSTLKGWEPQRQYEKRLNNVMNKDKGE